MSRRFQVSLVRKLKIFCKNLKCWQRFKAWFQVFAKYFKFVEDFTLSSFFFQTKLQHPVSNHTKYQTSTQSTPKIVHFNIYYSLNMFWTWNRNKMWSEKRIVGLSLGYDGDLFSSECSGDGDDDALFSPCNTTSFSLLSRQQCLFLSFLSFLLFSL